MSGLAWVATQAALTSSARAGSKQQERAHLGRHQWVLKRDRTVGVRDLAQRRCVGTRFVLFFRNLLTLQQNMCGATRAFSLNVLTSVSASSTLSSLENIPYAIHAKPRYLGTPLAISFNMFDFSIALTHHHSNTHLPPSLRPSQSSAQHPYCWQGDGSTIWAGLIQELGLGIRMDQIRDEWEFLRDSSEVYDIYQGFLEQITGQRYLQWLALRAISPSV
ncbi:hypothetical protein FB451DRAFT_1443135 [Mycena latifolia]|nr:hypothetical protein FB451DRAFT_1443135 [Mycena latifolia]